MEDFRKSMRPVWKPSDSCAIEIGSSSMGDPFGVKSPEAEENKIFSIDSSSVRKKETEQEVDEIRINSEIVLKRFSPERIDAQNGARVRIVGSSGSGRTHLVTELLSFFSNTDHCKIYSPFRDKKLIHRCASKSILFDDELEEQVGSFKKEREERNSRGDDSLAPSVLCIDDFPDHKHRFVDRWLFENGDPKGCVVFTVHEYFLDSKLHSTSTNRGNISFIRSISSEVELKTFYQDHRFVSEHMMFQDFKKLFAKCTRDHGFMVVDNTTSSENPEDRLFFYKASNRSPKFSLGGKRKESTKDDETR